jgi:hypothetical protein
MSPDPEGLAIVWEAAIAISGDAVDFITGDLER